MQETGVRERAIASGRHLKHQTAYLAIARMPDYAAEARTRHDEAFGSQPRYRTLDYIPADAQFPDEILARRQRLSAFPNPP